MPTIYWNPNVVENNGILPFGNTNGIGIAESPQGGHHIPNFQDRVRVDLENIYALPSGANLINAVVNAIPGKRLGIVAPRIWNDGGWGSNECACLGGDSGRTLVATAIGGGGNNTVINSLKLKMNTSGHHGDHHWLRTQLQLVPRYRLQGAVVAVPNNIPLLDVDVERWLNYSRPLYYGVAPLDLPDIKNAIMVFLSSPIGPPLQRSAGSHSRVYYDPRKNFNSLGVRPAFIGLAHELVHHYYNMQGAQLSHSEDSNHFSTVLYEYMCVGLGPWAGADISENAIRADAGVPARTQYA